MEGGMVEKEDAVEMDEGDRQREKWMNRAEMDEDDRGQEIGDEERFGCKEDDVEMDEGDR